MKEFYRVSEVMEILNLGRTKTYDLIRAGVIPSVDMNGSEDAVNVCLRSCFTKKIETIISTCKRNESTAQASQPAIQQPVTAFHRGTK